jgi:hypothetical protein
MHARVSEPCGGQPLRVQWVVAWSWLVAERTWMQRATRSRSSTSTTSRSRAGALAIRHRRNPDGRATRSKAPREHGPSPDRGAHLSAPTEGSLVLDGEPDSLGRGSGLGLPHNQLDQKEILVTTSPTTILNRLLPHFSPFIAWRLQFPGSNEPSKQTVWAVDKARRIRRANPATESSKSTATVQTPTGVRKLTRKTETEKIICGHGEEVLSVRSLISRRRRRTATKKDSNRLRSQIGYPLRAYPQH